MHECKGIRRLYTHSVLLVVYSLVLVLLGLKLINIPTVSLVLVFVSSIQTIVTFQQNVFLKLAIEKVLKIEIEKRDKGFMFT